MLKKILFSYILLSCTLLIASTTILTIEGTGDSQELLRTIGKKFEQLNSSIKIVVPNSIGSSGGIKKVIDGDSQLGRVARDLTHKEKSKVNYILFGFSPIVFVVNSMQTNMNFTSQDIINIFSGKIKKFDSIDESKLKGKIYVIRREYGDSSLSVIESNLNGFKDAGGHNSLKNNKHYAGKIVYTTSEALQLLTKYKNTIGYLPLSSAINSGLNIINFNNIAPSSKNIKSGKYKLVAPFGLIYKGKLKGLQKEFVDFLKTNTAKKIMQEYGVVSTF